MERSATADRLKQLLERVIAEGDAGARVSAGAIDLQADFAELGINSVDLLEFVLGLEQEFGVRVLDDMLPEDLPVNLAGWLEVLLRAESSRAT
jgi:acyl carrier protein